MRHHQVIGVAAVRKDAEAAHGPAEIFLAALARTAGSASDPRMRQHARADLDPFRVGTDRHHLADILVAERHRQLHATVGQAQPLAAAKIKITIRQMQIAMADAGRQNLQQDLAARRLWRGLLVELQRLTANADLEHSHRRFSPGPVDLA